MKKIIFLSLLILSSAGVFATNLRDEPEKILKIFHRDFPNIKSQMIYHIGESYMVYFKNEEEDVAYRIYYNNDGNLLQTIKYYSAESLAPFIRSKVNAKYKNKIISSVTDITNDSEHFYQIVLEDGKSWIYLKVDDNGSMQVEKKLKKQK